MEHAIDTREPREPRAPTFDPEAEKLALRVSFLDRGIPLDRSKALSAEGVRCLAADKATGEPQWLLETGPVAGTAGRLRVEEMLAEREHVRGLGPDPLEVVLQRLEREREVPRAEVLPFLRHRIRRLEDGTISFSADPSAPPRIGGDEVLELALRWAYKSVMNARATAPLTPASTARPDDPDRIIAEQVRARHRFSV
jgi:hypothetical protein